MYPKEFSPALAIGLVLICVYLLTIGKLSGWQFAFALFASLLIVVGLHNADVIERMTLKGPGGSEAVMEMRQLRNEVYAKVDELKKVAAGIATFTVSSIITSNRLVGRDHQDRMLSQRDDLDTFLRETGIADDQRAKTILPITRVVDWDMRHRIIVDAVSRWRVPRDGDPNNPTDRDAFQRELQQILQQPDRLKALADVEAKVRYLFDPGNPQLQQGIEQYRRMLTSGQLPILAPQDDLKKSPIE